MRTLTLLILVPLALLAFSAGCSKPPDAPSSGAANAAMNVDLDSIPPVDASKYTTSRDFESWQNPHLIVREDGIGFVDLSNHEIHILQPNQIPAKLASLPRSAWPYGRVVLITEAVPTAAADQTKADLRKNRGLLAGTLKELDVQIREAP